MAKKRIYDAAKEYKISSNALLKILRELKFTPKSHMSVATDEMLSAIKNKFEAEKEAVKKDIEQKEKPKPKPKPPEVKAPAAKVPKAKASDAKAPEAKSGDKKEAESKKGDGSFDKRLAKLSTALKKTGKGKRKRFDKKKKGATMATIGGGKKTKKYKKHTKEDGQDIITDDNVIEVNEFMTVAELAREMDMKPAELIAACFKLGLMASINQRLDMETIETLALECEFSIREKAEVGIEARQDEVEENLLPRAPIVTVMGHVDHGKTSLLDHIRHTNVVSQEAGAITQHIGAYEVHHATGRVVFIDTPGHAAFTAMRARGAQITDIVILVVAADEAVMPQTIEAIDHARAAGVPIIVAINKMDKPAANSEKIKQELSKQNLLAEEWGGKTIMIEISAKTGLGIDTLLEMIQLQTEMLDLMADPTIRGQGVVVEAKLERGRGPISTVIIQKGTVKIHDPIVAGNYSGRVRVMLSDQNQVLDEIGPSTPARIMGLGGVPQAGDSFVVVEDDSEAREIAMKRTQLKREQDIRRGFGNTTLEKIFEQIKEGQVRELRLIIKADVDGSAEVLSETLSKIATDEVRTIIIHKGVGAVNESDVLLAAASDAIILGFNVAPDGRARDAAAREKVDIRQYSIIYEAEEDIRLALEGMLSPEITEEFIGAAEVRQVFKVPKAGNIGGCFVKEGTIHRSDKVHLVRDGRIIHTGNIGSLRRFKEDVREVASGYECGISIENFNDIKVGDSIEVYQLKETAKKLQ
jgi:translation initiation factor IF-2